MWGAIIQAIEHAAGRINKGAGTGLEIAKGTSDWNFSRDGSSGGNVTDMSKVGTKVNPSEVKGLVDSFSNKEDANAEETEAEE